MKKISLTLLLVIAFFATGFTQNQLPKVDSLEKLLDAKSDTAKVNMLILIGKQYQQTNQHTAKSVFYKSLQLSDSLNYLSGMAQSLKLLAEVNIASSDYKKAYTYINRSLEFYKTLGDIKGVASCFLNLSYINNRLANYPLALEQASNSLILARQTHSLIEMALAYNNMGTIYDNMGDYKSSLKNYQKALEIYSSTNNRPGLARIYINISIVYNRIGRTHEAEMLLNKAVAIGKETNDRKLLAVAYGNIGMMYDHIGNYSKALEYYELSLKIKQELSDRYSIMISEINIGDSYLKLTKVNLALHHINNAISIGIKINAKRELIEAYTLKAKCYEIKGDYASAYNALSSKVMLNDSVFGQEQMKYMVDVDNKNEIKQLESENQILRQQNIIDQLQLENNRFIRYYLLIGLLFAIVLIGLLIYQSSERRKNARRLDEVNKQLVQTNKQLRKSETDLAESNRAKDKFFSIISHDLRNPLSSMISFVRILKRDYDTLKFDERHTLIDEFEKVVNRTGNLLENLLMWSRSQTKNLNMAPTRFAARSILDENADLHEPSLITKEIKLVIKEDLAPVEIYADINMLSTVLRNLLSNAIKFTHQGGHIDIGYDVVNGDCVYFVKDSGICIAPDQTSHIFTLGEVAVRTGTASEKGSGLGLVLCKEFVEKNNGKIWLESQPGKGTTFYFSVPVSIGDEA